jgi:hypothetical protein
MLFRLNNVIADTGGGPGLLRGRHPRSQRTVVEAIDGSSYRNVMQQIEAPERRRSYPRSPCSVPR